MRTWWLAFLLLLVPTLAWAGDEDKVHGDWHVVAARQGKTEVQVPPEIALGIRFDKAAKSWTVSAKFHGESHQANGKWSLNGAKCTFAVEGFDGQKLPSSAGMSADLDFAFEGDKLVFSMQGVAIILRRGPPPAKQP